jgi:L-cysteine desulfidase
MNLNPKVATLSLTALMQSYSALQSSVMTQVAAAACNISNAQPGQFLMLQFMMSTVSQVGQSISNLVSQVQGMITNSVRNQKS